MNNLGAVTQGFLAVILAGVSASPEATEIKGTVQPSPTVQGRIVTTPATIVGRIKQCP